MNVDLVQQDLKVLIQYYKTKEAQWGDEEPEAKLEARLNVQYFTELLEKAGV